MTEPANASDPDPIECGRCQGVQWGEGGRETRSQNCETQPVFEIRDSSQMNVFTCQSQLVIAIAIAIVIVYIACINLDPHSIANFNSCLAFAFAIAVAFILVLTLALVFVFVFIFVFVFMLVFYILNCVCEACGQTDGQTVGQTDYITHWWMCGPQKEYSLHSKRQRVRVLASLQRATCRWSGKDNLVLATWLQLQSISRSQDLLDETWIVFYIYEYLWHNQLVCSTQCVNKVLA